MSKQSSSPIPAPVADDTGLSQLVTEDQTLLLNVIDQLRELRISTVVPLPEIIVCGDQSSGKSSVLEAISRLSFPRGDTLCTTFATELALRRAPARKISVSIQPANTRDEHAKLHLSNFEPPSERIEDFEMVIKAAKDCLATSSLVSRNSFSEDTLRVEVSHPDWPQSTLVDLPGLIHSPNPGQSSADVRLVKDLVKRYMKRERSIILAVVSAGNDLANQEVLHLAQQIDPDGKRTLGVITKPDKTERGSEGEKVMINLAKNELTKFKLGWQVLKNRGYESRECTMDERDQQESEFFESSPWGRALEPTQLGVGALRNRLSELLLDQIRSALPEVVTNIRKKLNESEKSIEVLGPPRDTSPEKKKYLVNISRDFQRIVQQSLVGDYLDDFFYSSDLPQEATRRLRAALQNLNESFAKKMYDRGHKWEIRSVDSKCLLQPDSKHAPKIVSQDKYISLIKDMMDQNRGTELSGTFNPRLIGALFRQQSEKWSTIAEDHLESVLAVAKEHLTLTATHVAHKQTARNLQRGLINVEMEKKRKMLFGKLQELTKAYQRCHPITYSNHYSETLHRTREKQLLQGDPRIDLTNGQDLGILEPATEILGFMNAYYAVSYFVMSNPLLETKLKIWDSGHLAHVHRQCCRSGS